MKILASPIDIYVTLRVGISSGEHICEVLFAIFEFRVCHFLVSDMGGGGSRQKMTKCDMGEGGSKIAIFGVTYFLHGP